MIRVNGWSYCAIRSASGAIVQLGQWVELLRNRVRLWSYCAIGSGCGAIAQSGQWVELLRNRVSGWSYCVIDTLALDARTPSAQYRTDKPQAYLKSTSRVAGRYHNQINPLAL